MTGKIALIDENGKEGGKEKHGGGGKER